MTDLFDDFCYEQFASGDYALRNPGDSLGRISDTHEPDDSRANVCYDSSVITCL